MNYINHLDLFSGIGGFALGLRRAGGFRTVAFSEIDKHGCDVLQARFPGIPNLGRVEDVNRDGIEGDIDIITAGFPCQDLSVAGRRAGLGGERSGLFWHVVRLASEFRPEWLVLENVPGLLSSNDGRDMEIVVGAFLDCGYSVAWRVLDAQYFGLAQRRRRVWIVCHSDPERAGAVLFESEGGAGDSAAREETRADVAYCLAARAGSSGSSIGQGHNTTYIPELSYSLGASTGGVSGKEQQQTLVAEALRCGGRSQGAGSSYDNTPCVAHTLRAEGYDAGEDGTGRGTPLIPVSADALPQQQRSNDGSVDVGDISLGNCVVGPSDYTRGSGDTSGLPRRLDGARYRSLGNAVPVPVVTWIGERIMEAENAKA